MKDDNSPSGIAKPTDITLIMETYELRDPSQICFLSDSDLRRIPGFGRAKVNRLRLDYPYEEDARRILESIAERRHRRDLLEMKRMTESRVIKLGSLHGVRSVRLIGNKLVVACKNDPIFRSIEILWGLEVPAVQRPVEGCFGPQIEDGELMHVASFPTLHGVTAIKILPVGRSSRSYGEFEVAEARIESEKGIFSFDLLVDYDGESQLGFDPEKKDSELDGLLWELSSDPKVADAQSRCARGLERMVRDVIRGRIASGLKAYRAVLKDIQLVLSEADSLASIRDIKIQPEIFGLTQTDVDAFGIRGVGVPAEHLFSTNMVRSGNSPMRALQSIMRHLVDKGNQAQIRKAVMGILDDSPWLKDDQRERLLHCVRITEEFEVIREWIASAGPTGVIRKSIVESINQRHGQDGGMARRAFLRWVEGPDSGFLMVKTSKGIVLRTHPAIST